VRKAQRPKKRWALWPRGEGGDSNHIRRWGGGQEVSSRVALKRYFREEVSDQISINYRGRYGALEKTRGDQIVTSLGSETSASPNSATRGPLYKVINSLCGDMEKR
jgi:hypothetical protein